MVIIYFDSDHENLYICTEDSPMKRMSVKDQTLLDFIPNDDIVYVQSAHIVTKQQFAQWLRGDMQLAEIPIPQQTTLQPMPGAGVPRTTSNRKFIHPTGNGGVCIEDIRTAKFPQGVVMMNKWDFICLDEIGGEDILDSSLFLRTLIGRGSIEVVPEDYVRANIHKARQQQASLRDAELDRIIIKDDRRGSAERVADRGGLDGNDVSIPIYIEGRF